MLIPTPTVIISMSSNSTSTMTDTHAPMCDLSDILRRQALGLRWVCQQSNTPRIGDGSQLHPQIVLRKWRMRKSIVLHQRRKRKQRINNDVSVEDAKNRGTLEDS